jgi:hypothetical protein
MATHILTILTLLEVLPDLEYFIWLDEESIELEIGAEIMRQDLWNNRIYPYTNHILRNLGSRPLPSSSPRLHFRLLIPSFPYLFFLFTHCCLAWKKRKNETRTCLLDKGGCSQLPKIIYTFSPCCAEYLRLLLECRRERSRYRYFGTQATGVSREIRDTVFGHLTRPFPCPPSM